MEKEKKKISSKKKVDVKTTNKKQIAIVSLFIIGIIAITTAVTYALFTYATNGLTENKITVGGITFHYKELDGMGRGIGISDALPVASNENAKTEEPAFNFRITSTTGENVEVPYVVTARMSSNSDIDLRSVVDLHLTEVNGTNETATALFSGDGVVKYNSLNSYNGNDNEKIIYTGTAYRNHDKSFKLRMWIDQSTNLADGTCSLNTYTNQKACETAGETWEYKYNGKEFSLTVNVYASGSTVSSQDIESRQNTNIETLSINNSELTPVTGESYDYSMSTNDRNITLDIETENENATVEVIRTDSTYANPISYNIDRRGIISIAAVSNNLALIAGDNYFKIVVTPADGVSPTKTYKLKVTKIPSTDATLSSLSISDCPLNETFGSQTTSYTCTTAESNLVVTATPTDGGTPTITGNTGLKNGSNTITIVVAPEDTTAQSKTYTITVTKIVPFATESWDTIISNVRSDNTDAYKIGDTRQVTVTGYGTHTLRLVNKTKCTNETSQTGCGFVVEFADVLMESIMIYAGNNYGGYPASTVYTNYLKNNSNNWIYNMLPSDLRAGIIDTVVISGHGSGESNNYTTTDKLYLLSEKEVFGTSIAETTGGTTRQLDYYRLSNANKSKGNTMWWLRSPKSDATNSFLNVYNGVFNYSNPNAKIYISPAFRIG